MEKKFVTFFVFKIGILFYNIGVFGDVGRNESSSTSCK